MASNLLLTRKNFKAQYQTALWFVRFAYRKTGIIASASEHVHMYHGFQDAANRDGKNYPTFISGLIFAHALLAWQNNPNRSK